MNEHLKLVNLDKSWLINELKKQNIYSPKQVLLASFDTNGTLHIDIKKHDPPPLDVNSILNHVRKIVCCRNLRLMAKEKNVKTLNESLEK